MINVLGEKKSTVDWKCRAGDGLNRFLRNREGIPYFCKLNLLDVYYIPGVMYDAKPLSFNALGEVSISLPDRKEGEVQESTNPLKIPQG